MPAQLKPRWQAFGAPRKSFAGAAPAMLRWSPLVEARQLVCPECGAPLDARRVSCPGCGRSLGERTVFGIDAARAHDLTGTTRHRLDELAAGWELPGKAASSPAPPAPAPRFEEGLSEEVTRA